MISKEHLSTLKKVQNELLPYIFIETDNVLQNPELVESCRKEIEEIPNYESDSQCLLFVGKAYQALGNHDLAYENFKKMYSISKEDYNFVHVALSEVIYECLCLDKYGEALAWSKVQMKDQPQFSSEEYSANNCNYGIVKFLSGDFDGGIDCVKKIFIRRSI